MAPVSRAASFALASKDAQRLERRLRVDEARVREALGQAPVSQPVCAVAFIYVGQVDLAMATHTYALSEATRDAALRRRGEQGLWLLWSPPDWDQADLLASPSTTMVDEAKAVAGKLRRAGCTNPEGAFVCELAYRLARADWSDVMTTTRDFACWASDHEVTEVALENFRALAPAAAVEAFATRSWLRFPDEYAP